MGHEAGLSALGDAPSEFADTLESTARSYIASRTRLGEATRHRYGRYLERDFADLSPRPITLITRQDVIDWVQVQQTAGSASKTIKNKLRFLSSVTHVIDAKPGHEFIDARDHPGTRILRRRFHRGQQNVVAHAEALEQIHLLKHEAHLCEPHATHLVVELGEVAPLELDHARARAIIWMRWRIAGADTGHEGTFGAL